MPRLTDKEYLSRRDFLVDAWKLFPSIYSALSYNQQMELHAFFQPTKELTDEEAIEHRRTITTQHPSLPSRTGKSFKLAEAQAKRLQQQLEHESPQDPTKPVRMPVPRGKQHITVYGLARPKVDVKELAEALLDYLENKEGEAA